MTRVTPCISKSVYDKCVIRRCTPSGARCPGTRGVKIRHPWRREPRAPHCVVVSQWGGGAGSTRTGPGNAFVTLGLQSLFQPWAPRKRRKLVAPTFTSRLSRGRHVQ